MLIFLSLFRDLAPPLRSERFTHFCYEIFVVGGVSRRRRYRRRRYDIVVVATPTLPPTISDGNGGQ